jgi:putative ABC transport system ATP-binding protein
MSNYQGDIRVGSVSWQHGTDEELSRVVTYAGPDPLLFSGSIRDNIVFGLLRQPPPAADGEMSASERLRRKEAERSGNPVDLPGSDWIEFDARGNDDLDREIVRALEAVGFEPKLHAFGLAGKIDATALPDVADRLLLARGVTLRRLTEGEYKELIEPFDPLSYNNNATIAENLLFGLPIGTRFHPDRLASDSYARSVLEAEALMNPLADIGLKMAETVLDLYDTLHVNKTLFERFSVIRSEDIPAFQRIIADVHAAGSVSKLAEQSRAPLVGIALGYVEPKHRLGLVDDVFRRRLLRARQSFRRHLAPADVDAIEFYDPAIYMSAATIQDNLLFGRISHGIGHAEAIVHRVLRDVLRELELEPLVHRVGLDHPVGVGGRTLFAQDRAAIALARCMLARSQTIVLDGALAGYASADVRSILARMRAAFEDTTLIVAVPPGAPLDQFDVTLSFEGPRLIETRAVHGSGTQRSEKSAARETARTGAG